MGRADFCAAQEYFAGEKKETNGSITSPRSKIPFEILIHTFACDGERCLEGGSDPMKIQVRVGPSRMAGQGLFSAQDLKSGLFNRSERRFRAENVRVI